ncbi:MAG: complex I NDUFA9 subunit family protein [Burkholderiaceae bacterium]
MNRILVLGASGFLGRHLCEKAAQLRCRVTAPTRRRESAKHLWPLPWVDTIEADVHDEATLTQLLQRHSAVVNLIGILHGSERDFRHAHVELAQKLVRACRSAGVQRAVQISALGAATDAPSHYQRSKAEAEDVLTSSGLDVTILRPSVMFGEGDQLLNMFAKLQGWLPVVPLAHADARFQPVWVQDVAQAVVQLLGDAMTQGSALGTERAPVYEACGPDVVTLRQMVQLAGRLSERPRPVLALPPFLGRLQAWTMKLAPGEPLLSSDNLDSMQVDNVASGTLPDLHALGITPSALKAIAPTYLHPRETGVLIARRRAAGRF